jgi:hypothetical protein
MTIALQSVTSERIGLTLSSLPSLSRFSTLSVTQLFTRKATLDYSLGSIGMLPFLWIPSTSHQPGYRSGLGHRFGAASLDSLPTAQRRPRRLLREPVIRFEGFSYRGD